MTNIPAFASDPVKPAIPANQDQKTNQPRPNQADAKPNPDKAGVAK